MKQLEIHCQLQIAKTPKEVYEAIIDPEQMTNYFISKASGKMKAHTEVYWEFEEFEEAFPIQVKKLREAEFISFTWEMEGRELLIEIHLEPRENNSCLVKISEKAMPNDQTGINWLKGNTEGWANFLACLKAWLEYGINLRKGGFDFLKNKAG
ncbi:SRPBCC domain-containing protein [Salegentibacter sp. HM20]